MSTYYDSFDQKNTLPGLVIRSPPPLPPTKESSSFLRKKITGVADKVAEKVENTFENIFKYLIIGAIILSIIFLFVFGFAFYYVWNNTDKNTVKKNSFVSTVSILYLVQILGGVLSITVLGALFVALLRHKIHKIDTEKTVVGIKIVLVVCFFLLFLLFLFNSIFFGNAKYYDSRAIDATTIDSSETKTEGPTTNSTKTVTVLTITTITTTRESTGNVIATGTVLHYIFNIAATVLSGAGLSVFVLSLAINKDSFD